MNNGRCILVEKDVNGRGWRLTLLYFAAFINRTHTFTHTPSHICTYDPSYFLVFFFPSSSGDSEHFDFREKCASALCARHIKISRGVHRVCNEAGRLDTTTGEKRDEQHSLLI